MEQPFKLILVLALFWIGVPLATAQMEPPPTVEAPPTEGWTEWQGGEGLPRLRARLSDAAAAAAQHKATVEVEAENVFLHSPVVSTAKLRQGLLRYQVDRCPPILTVDTNLQFGSLASGEHTIIVAIIGPKDEVIAPEARLQIRIP